MNPKDNTVVLSATGKIQGSYEDGLYVFKGIPYAAAPVGARRWLPPELIKPWTGVRPATSFGPIAPQNPGQLNIMIGKRGEEPQSEDCLFLNVWTPGLDDSHRPVMVWVHGGAFMMGSGSSLQHPGSTLAKRGNVVTVSINYRLGCLGFLHLKKLTGGRVPSAGIEGLLDQIAALHWVQDNIVAFGGDPGNVTVFGESAGAMSIGCLLAMQKARGLFHKAILQSGANTVKPLDQAIQLSQILLDILGVNPEDANTLRSLSAERLISAQVELSAKMLELHIRGAVLKPVIDGENLTTWPIEAVKSGSADGITVLAGSNLEEARILTAGDKSLATLDKAGLIRRVKQILPVENVIELIESYQSVRAKRGAGINPGDILVAIQTDLQFRIPAIRLVEAQSAYKMPAYNYLFNWNSVVPGLGACHALDVGFVFGMLNEEFHGIGPAADSLAGKMQDSWIAFARTGNPGCKSLGEWPPYGAARKTMILGQDCHIEDAPYDEERRVWSPVPNSLLGW
jgi:para-nitrobenzyl esterase